MRSLESLIRLARFKVEELQKQMAALEVAKSDMTRQVDNLDASVPEEQVAANAMKDGFVAYGSYAQAIIKRKQNIRTSIAEIDEQAEKLRAELEDAFAELKKFEILEERRVAGAKAEADKKVQAEIDDVAGMRAAG